MEDIPWISVPSCLDGQCILIEPPDLRVLVTSINMIILLCPIILCALSIWFIDDQEMFVFEIEVPVFWQG
jgi:hypothetical protein